MRASSMNDRWTPDEGASAPGGGLMHRLDARTKMTISLLGSVAVMVLANPVALGLLLAASLGYALTLRRWRMLLACHAGIAAMLCVAYGLMHVMHLAVPRMSPLEPVRLLVPFLRLAIMVNVVLALALSTRVQAMLSTLKSLRLPFCVYIPTAVMVRFVPSFVADVRQVSETLKTRGYRVNPLFLLRHPLLSVRLLFVPLVFRALRAADELGIAAELKGLGYADRLRPCRTVHLARRDWAAMATALVLVAAGVGLQLRAGWGGGGMF